jgi:phosphoribosylformimino-5-aminoimidazole carboxamide ribotide isomerase
MQVIPALDVRGGRVVRLRQGDLTHMTDYRRDPLDLARAYAAAGARRLHLVDLDAATGGAHNRALVEQLVTRAGIEVQVAGGVRSEQDAARWLEIGASAVVLGTLAAQEPGRLTELARRHSGRILAALDVRGQRSALSGWTEVGPSPASLLRAWDEAPLAGVVLTSVDRDGTLSGPDLELFAGVRRLSRHPLTYSGGVRSLEDLEALAAAGAAAAILGRALLEGRVRLESALRLG